MDDLWLLLAAASGELTEELPEIPPLDSFDAQHMEFASFSVDTTWINEGKDTYVRSVSYSMGEKNLTVPQVYWITGWSLQFAEEVRTCANSDYAAGARSRHVHVGDFLQYFGIEAEFELLRDEETGEVTGWSLHTAPETEELPEEVTAELPEETDPLPDEETKELPEEPEVDEQT